MKLPSVEWTGKRVAIAAVGLLDAYYVLTSIFVSTTGPKGERSSSYGTVAGGVQAWKELLEKRGHPVAQIRDAISGAGPAPGTTVIVVDGGALRNSEQRSLGRFVRGGGRLVLAGSVPTGFAGELLPAAPRWKLAGERVSVPITPAPENVGVERVTGDGHGTLTDPGSAVPVLGGRDGDLVAAARLGRGRVLVVADPSPLTNARLAQADNAQLALDLAGANKRPVAFVETVHGYGGDSGTGAVPARWQVAIGLLCLAGLLFLFARGKRLGPPEKADRDLPPPRAAYADALAATLVKAKDNAAAVEPVHAAARRQIVHRAALGPDASAEVIKAAGEQLGLSDEEAAAVAASEDFDIIATGRALARLNGGKET